MKDHIAETGKAEAPTFLAGAGYFAWLRNRMRDALVRLGS
jgi:hypothetical protein